MAIWARDGSKTDRKRERGAVREILGVSRDPAPGIRSALRAAARLAEIVNLASSGRFRLSIYDRERGAYFAPYETLREIKDEEVYD